MQRFTKNRNVGKLEKLNMSEIKNVAKSLLHLDDDQFSLKGIKSQRIQNIPKFKAQIESYCNMNFKLQYSTFPILPLYVPYKFSKILVINNFIQQNFILKNLVLEITSRKIFLIFLFIRYDTTIIQLLFWSKKPHQFAFVILNEVRLNNIILFLCIRSANFNIIFIILGLTLCSVNLISIGSLSSSSFPPNYCYIFD